MRRSNVAILAQNRQTEIEVTGTALAATVANMVLGKSYAEAQAAPLVLHHFQQTRFQ